jgi:general secretion pathway protein G
MNWRLLGRQHAAPPAAVRVQRGHTQYEFALVAALFAILVGIAANRLNAYQIGAESVAAEQLIGSLRLALQLKVSKLKAAQRSDALAAILNENPMDWLYEKPRNYLGEYFIPEHEKLPPGSWYFDRNRKTLVYLSNEPKRFGSGATILLKFKVESIPLPSKPAQMQYSVPIENLSLVQIQDRYNVSGQ